MADPTAAHARLCASVLVFPNCEHRPTKCPSVSRFPGQWRLPSESTLAVRGPTTCAAQRLPQACTRLSAVARCTLSAPPGSACPPVRGPVCGVMSCLPRPARSIRGAHQLRPPDPLRPAAPQPARALVSQHAPE
eukprot:24937-Rhodomonas_salina.2